MFLGYSIWISQCFYGFHIWIVFFVWTLECFMGSCIASCLGFCAERKNEMSLHAYVLWDFIDNEQYPLTHVSSVHLIWMLFSFLLLVLACTFLFVMKNVRLYEHFDVYQTCHLFILWWFVSSSFFAIKSSIVNLN